MVEKGTSKEHHIVKRFLWFIAVVAVTTAVINCFTFCQEGISSISARLSSYYIDLKSKLLNKLYLYLWLKNEMNLAHFI